MAIATLVIHAFLGESKIIPANHILFMQSIRVMLVIFALLCVLGVFASMARGKRQLI